MALALLPSCTKGQAQTLIYSLSYAETRASFKARYPNGAFGEPINEKLAMLRQHRKTEIYSISMVDGKRSLLFSDEGMNLEISPTGTTGGDKAYVTGVVREWRPAPSPGAYAEPPALYEISLDGAKRFRRLLETKPNQSPAILNAAGTKAMVEVNVNEKLTVSIYSVPAWELLHNFDLNALTQAHCPDCLAMSYGWLAKGDRLFFDLDLGDEDGIDPKTHNVPGTYMVSEDGADLGSVSQEIGHSQLAGYVHPNVAARYLIAQLPDGNYLFQDYAAKQGGSPGNLGPFLVISSPDSKFQKQFPLKFPIGTCQVSPSGKYLAYLEERRGPNHPTELHLWSRDLQSGEEKELVAAPSPNPPTSPEPNVVLSVLGWAN